MKYDIVRMLSEFFDGQRWEMTGEAARANFEAMRLIMKRANESNGERKQEIIPIDVQHLSFVIASGKSVLFGITDTESGQEFMTCLSKDSIEAIEVDLPAGSPKAQQPQQKAQQPAAGKESEGSQEPEEEPEGEDEEFEIEAEPEQNEEQPKKKGIKLFRR